MKLGAPSPLGAARGAFYAFLLGMALYTYRIAVDETASLRRELQQRQEDDGGCVGAAAHEALAARVAQQDGVIAELREGSVALGAALRESRESAAGFASRLLAMEATLQQQKGEGAEGERRQMQRAVEPERQGDYVLQIKRNVTRTQCGGPGSDASNDGNFDMSRCADHVFRQCHRKECIGYNGDHSGGKHRRAQAAALRCKPADLAARAAEVTTECCDEPDEDCTDGTPHTCNAGCAAIFLSFWGECRSALGKDSGRFEDAVALCEAAAPAPPASAGTSLSLAEQLNVQCTDGTATEDCVPTCTADLHGFQLLLNIDGEDSKLSCELHHALYSWVGAATDGGYLGSDFQAFFSAVVSGAAGVYVGMLVENAGIGTALVVTPGQSVSVTGHGAGALVAWGVGTFSVDERGSLALTAMLIQGAITVAAGASLTAQGSTFSNGLTVSGTASLSGCTLAASATIDMSGGGSLSLASMAVPAAALGAAENTLSCAGSTLRLDAVTVPEAPDAGALTGIMTVVADGSKTIEPQGFGVGSPTFAVSSGPCTVSEGGRCVGRPEGYGAEEHCAITVSGGGGVLGPCPVFDIFDVYDGDSVTLPRAPTHGGSDCPEGAALVPGDAIAWSTDGGAQGSVGWYDGNGCAAKGTCGLPYNNNGGLGGGWELCFA